MAQVAAKLRNERLGGASFAHPGALLRLPQPETPIDVQLPAGFALDYFNPRRELDYGTAQAISRLFRQEYGDRYYRDVTGNPEFIQDEVRSGRWLAFVIRDFAGEIAGHGALMPIGNGHYRFARGLVAEQYRKFRLSSALTDARQQYADSQLQTDILSTEAVTAHAATQRTFESRGFVPTGIHPGKFADRFVHGESETTAILTRLEGSEIRGPRVIFVPVAYQQVVQSIAGHLGLTRFCRLVGDGHELSGIGTGFTFNRSGAEEQGIVALTTESQTDPAVIQQLAVNEFERGTRLLTVRLSTSSPAIEAQAAALRSIGFHFAAFDPGLNDDGIVLQKSTEDAGAKLRSIKLEPAVDRLRNLILRADFN